MKKFSRLDQFSHKGVVTVVILLLSLGFVIYLVSSGFNRQKENQPKEILSNKDDEANNLDTTPSISIVVIGLGLDKALFEKVMNLPKEVTLGFSPYSPYLDYILELTQKEGRDIIMNIPMETLLPSTSNYYFEDNGPYALTSALEDAENSQRLDFIISKAIGFNGYYTSLNDSFTDKVENLTFLLNRIKKTEQYIMYNDPRKVKSFITVATELNMQDRILHANILLDSKLEKSEIESRLNELKNVADAYGHAIGIIRAYNISIDHIGGWLRMVDESKYNIISLSELVSNRF